MKHLRYSLLLLLSIAFSNTSQAQSDPVWVNGINYELNEETKTASVTYGGDYVGDIVIPSSVKGYSVTSIGDHAFTGCNAMTSITMPNTITSIGERAFGECSGLTFITIPNAVTTISAFAFDACKGLTSITIPNSVKIIDRNVFMNCSGLTSIHIPDVVTSIGPSAFAYCSSLASITIPDAVTSIGRTAFEGCSSLTSITIPDAVKSIGFGAFSYCSSLTAVTIGSSVEEIDHTAFLSCTALTTVVCKAVTPPALADNVFAFIPEEAILYVPSGSEEAYRNDAKWAVIYFVKAINDIPTNIEAVKGHADTGASNSAMYNLGGQRISKPGRGIFIKNGKLQIAK